MPDPIVCFGGAGKTGRRIATRLHEAGHRVRLASRSTEPSFHWELPDSWAPALRGARAAYVAYAPDVSVPEAADRLGRLAALAREAGVERLVLLSGRGEPGALRAEAALAAAGVPWTVLRCSWFAQNFSEDFLRDDVVGGELALPAGEVGEPFVDADDVADVAVAALTQEGHGGATYELTGPRAIGFGEAARVLAAASGRPVAYVDVPRAEWVAGARAAGVPEDLVAVLDHLFGEVLDGRNAAPQDGVRRALGRPPRDFAEYARAAAAAGAWAAAGAR